MKRLKLRISVSKKIIGMVAMPILLICLIVGIVSANIMRLIITDEIEMQLKVGAYGISQTLEQRTLITEMNNDISNLHDYTDMDVTVFQGDTRVASTIANVVGTKMDSKIYETLQSGGDYFATDANVNGHPYFGYYIPFFVDGEFSGATFTGIPQEDANNVIFTTIFKIVSCILGYGIIFVVIALILAKKMVKNINKLREVINSLANNDLSVEYEKYDFAHDEIEESYNDMVDSTDSLKAKIINVVNDSNNLKDIANHLRENAEYIADTSNQISQAVESVAEGAASQAEDTTNAAQNVNKMSEELGKIKSNANDLNTIANSMDEAKTNVLNTLIELKRINEAMVNEMNSTNHQVNATGESVEQVQNTIEVIQDIADQTKLLSLNASIEAAHAGEHGKGFAVVAEEIGKLASQSANSSDEIDKILKQLVKNYDIIIQNVKSTSDNMSVQNEKLVETQNVFDTLEKDINETIGKIEEINTMVEYLNSEIGNLVDMITNTSAISEENSAATEETMASIQELTANINQVYEKAQTVDNSADELISEVSVFKTK